MKSESATPMVDNKGRDGQPGGRGEVARVSVIQRKVSRDKAGMERKG